MSMYESVCFHNVDCFLFEEVYQCSVCIESDSTSIGLLTFSACESKCNLVEFLWFIISVNLGLLVNDLECHVLKRRHM